MEPNSLQQQLPFQTVATTTTSALMEILSRYDALESPPVPIPNQEEVGVVRTEPVAHSVEIETTPIQVGVAVTHWCGFTASPVVRMQIANTLTPVTSVVMATVLPRVNEADSSKPRVGTAIK